MFQGGHTGPPLRGGMTVDAGIIVRYDTKNSNGYVGTRRAVSVKPDVFNLGIMVCTILFWIKTWYKIIVLRGHGTPCPYVNHFRKREFCRYVYRDATQGVPYAFIGDANQRSSSQTFKPLCHSLSSNKKGQLLPFSFITLHLTLCIFSEICCKSVRKVVQYIQHYIKEVFSNGRNKKNLCAL